jgi:membrane protease YdiL (CAAX protease family)
MRNKKEHRGEGVNAFIFFAIAIAISWAAWIAAIFFDFRAGEIAGNTLIGIGSAGPAIATLIVLFFRENKKHRHEYWNRLTDTRRIRAIWYAVMFLLPGAIVCASILLSIPFGGPIEQFQIVPELRGNWAAFMPFMAFLFLAGPLPQEMGWRGYGLHILLKKFNPTASSLIVAAFWATWSVPLVFVGDNALAAVSQDPVRLAAYFVNFLPLSFLFTWLFVGTGHSTASAVFFHFSFVFFAGIFQMESLSTAISTILALLIAGFILLKKGTQLGEKSTS